MRCSSAGMTFRGDAPDLDFEGGLHLRPPLPGASLSKAAPARAASRTDAPTESSQPLTCPCTRARSSGAVPVQQRAAPGQRIARVSIVGVRVGQARHAQPISTVGCWVRPRPPADAGRAGPGSASVCRAARRAPAAAKVSLRPLRTCSGSTSPTTGGVGLYTSGGKVAHRLGLRVCKRPIQPMTGGRGERSRPWP